MTEQDELSEEQIAEYKEAFELFSKDGESTLSGDDLATAMRSLGLNPTESDVKEIKKEVDDEYNGSVDFAQFVNFLKRYERPTDGADELYEAFRVFDKQNDGVVDAQEFRSYMMSLGEKLSEEELEEMMKEADIDGNGKIDYRAFSDLMLNT